MHRQQSSEEADRRNRFAQSSGLDTPRSASQPPKSNGESFLSATSYQNYNSPTTTTVAASGSPWGQQQQQPPRIPQISRSSSIGLPVPVRSASFAERSYSQSAFPSTMRDSRFASTFEDDESEATSDTQEFLDDRYLMDRGRHYLNDASRSRSQSLATSRPAPIGSPLQRHPPTELATSWTQSSGPLNIPSGNGGSRYGEIKPPGSRQQTADISNISPFVRDVGQILLDDGSAFRELWGNMPGRDSDGGPPSGTTSRRHSVSVVQPRRGVVGFNAPGMEVQDEFSISMSHGESGGGLMVSDDDLAADLNMLNLGGGMPSSSSKNGGGQSKSSLPPSQPSSLPVYAPLSRNLTSSDAGFDTLQIGGDLLNRNLRSPSEGGLSGSSGSPTRGPGLEPGFDTMYAGLAAARQHRPPPPELKTELTNTQFYGGGQVSLPSNPSANARFLAEQGIQYNGQHGQLSTSPTYTRQQGHFPVNAQLISPLSPTSPRGPQHAQQPQSSQHFFPQQMQHGRRPLEPGVQPVLSELGKGIPLHSLPSAYPLYIVEFKAGRTDLFYCPEPTLDIRVGDLVIVEADRGKDLGKVVNDSITSAEVEMFQRQQSNISAYNDLGVPVSPDSAVPPSGSKKEINPKRIYSKAQPQDTQLLVSKIQDEVKALQFCQSKVRQKKLPMEVIDAEYQWDRRKLTFYFVAEKRIDFRELVRELFRLYKTRIWMASLQGPGGSEQ